MKNFEEKIHIRNTTDTDNEVMKNLIHNKLEEDIKRQRESSVPIDVILGPDCGEKFRELFHIIRQKFNERGINSPTFPRLFFKKENAVNIRRTGEATSMFVNIFDTNIDDVLLKQMNTFRTIIHETYHSVGRLSLVAAEGKDENSNIKGIVVNHESAGASFAPKNAPHGEHGNLLEEGAAVQFETEMFEELKGLFPEETIDLYEEVMGQVKKDLESKKKSLSIDILKEIQKMSQYGGENIENLKEEMNLTNEEKERLFANVHILQYGNSVEKNYLYNEEYGSSMQVVNYLKKNIPDFLSLLEQARVHGKILPLARAIDGTFGSGWYRKIVTAKTSDAYEILTELIAIKP